MTKAGLSEKGKLIPQTPEEFQYMGDLYEKTLIERDKEISKLKYRNNILVQKIVKLRRRNK